MRTIVLLLLALLPLSAAGARAQAAPRSASADSAAIHEQSRRFSAAYLRGDAAAMAEMYTEDGAVFPDRSEAVVGRDALRRYWTWAPGSRVTRHLATPTRIHVEGDLAWDYGVYEIAGERDGRPWGPTHGKYVIVWKRGADGVWRMQLDMWNLRPQPAS